MAVSLWAHKPRKGADLNQRTPLGGKWPSLARNRMQLKGGSLRSSDSPIKDGMLAWRINSVSGLQHGRLLLFLEAFSADRQFPGSFTTSNDPSTTSTRRGPAWDRHRNLPLSLPIAVLLRPRLGSSAKRFHGNMWIRTASHVSRPQTRDLLLRLSPPKHYHLILRPS